MRGTILTRILITGLLSLGLVAAAAAEDPYARPDDTWISVSGTIESVSADAFVLDYGDGTITVEMDDGDRDADGYKLLAGDKVTVNGMIDDDLFEIRTIEAMSVYVEKLGTYFYASAVDEEDTFVTTGYPIVVSAATIQGTVTQVDDEEFKLTTAGGQVITVEVEEMPYDPLDDEGYQKIDIGDVVSVSGKFDNDFLEGREFVADGVVTLVD